MTLVFRHNAELEVNRADYIGSVTSAELRALVEFQAANPTWLTYDTLSWIAPSVDFDDVDLAALDTVYTRYTQLFETRQLLIFRRSAWICQSPRAEAHMAHWLSAGDTRTGMSSDLRRFDSFAEAGRWLVLNEAETAALESGEGFKEIVRYTIPARGFAR